MDDFKDLTLPQLEGLLEATQAECDALCRNGGPIHGGAAETRWCAIKAEMRRRGAA